MTSPALTPPPGNPRFPLFDSLRGVSVVTILVFHVAGFTGALANGLIGDVVTVLGPRALTLFFVISGFLLYRPFVRARVHGVAPPTLGRFFRRRALRIVPAYWVALSLLAAFPGLVGVLTGDWWRYYGFLQIYSADTVNEGIPVAWSLCVEVTFYLVLPFWALALRTLTAGAGRRRAYSTEAVTLGLVAAGGAAVQVLAAAGTLDELLASSLLGQSTWLALGMGLAVLSVAHEERPVPAVARAARHPGPCWLGAGVALVALVVLIEPSGLTGIIQSLNTSQPVTESIAVVVLTAVMIALFALPAVVDSDSGSRGVPRRILESRVVAAYGVVSYSLYLWHLPVAEYLIRSDATSTLRAGGLDLAARAPAAVTPLMLVLTLAVATAIAAASYRWVELPFLRRKER